MGMQGEILSQLRAKFEGVEAKILERAAEKLARKATTEDEAKAAVEAFGLPQLLETYGDARAQGATQTAILNYERKHGLKDGQRVPAPTAEPETPGGSEGGRDTQSTDEIAVLLRKLDTLQSEIGSLKSERVEETRRGKLDGIISQLPEPLRKPYQRLPVSELSEEGFSALTLSPKSV